MTTAYESLVQNSKVLRTVYSTGNDMFLTMMYAGAISVAAKELDAAEVTKELVTRIYDILKSLEINELPTYRDITVTFRNIQESEA